jgi:hypothetical protein
MYWRVQQCASSEGQQYMFLHFKEKITFDDFQIHFGNINIFSSQNKFDSFLSFEIQTLESRYKNYSSLHT